jgi:hypothetical protein
MIKTPFLITLICLILLGCNQPENIPASTNTVTTSPAPVIENSQPEPQIDNTPSTAPVVEETTTQENTYSNELTYAGSASDPQSGITQNYILKIKSDFSAASIGGGPYTIIEDQRDGSYMWLDGTIIGMSFRPSKNSCALFGSDDSYFCTLYRQ